MMKRLSIYLIVFFVSGGIFCVSSFGQDKHQTKVVNGAEQLDLLLPMLEGKRVALVVNQTSGLGPKHVHLLDTLLRHQVKVVKVFAPEHGFRGTGDPGEEIKDSKDKKTGIPIISIYGKNKKPTSKQMEGVDVVIFDIQDVGTRFYTYISTLHYVMEACAENGKDLIVTDRPNPNDYVDGPMREEGFRSFVGLDPLPVLHGLTVGELAQMINGEKWLAQAEDSCKLTVIPVKNWQHGDPYWLPVRPSPNLPTDQSIRLYPSLCFFEGTCVSVGRGTFFPFELLGIPDKNGGSFEFTPEAIKGMDMNPMHKGLVCYGEDLRELPFAGGLSLQFVLDFYERCGKNESKFFKRARWFDLLAGTDKLRKQIVEGLSEEKIREGWKADLDIYIAMRDKYLLYPDSRYVSDDK